MDMLRGYAFLDLLKGTPAEERIACAVVQDDVVQDEESEIADALARDDAE